MSGTYTIRPVRAAGAAAVRVVNTAFGVSRRRFTVAERTPGALGGRRGAVVYGDEFGAG